MIAEINNLSREEKGRIFDEHGFGKIAIERNDNIENQWRKVLLPLEGDAEIMIVGNKIFDYSRNVLKEGLLKDVIFYTPTHYSTMGENLLK